MLFTCHQSTFIFPTVCIPRWLDEFSTFHLIPENSWSYYTGKLWVSYTDCWFKHIYFNKNMKLDRARQKCDYALSTLTVGGYQWAHHSSSPFLSPFLWPHHHSLFLHHSYSLPFLSHCLFCTHPLHSSFPFPDQIIILSSSFALLFPPLSPSLMIPLVLCLSYPLHFIPFVPFSVHLSQHLSLSFSFPPKLLYVSFI